MLRVLTLSTLFPDASQPTLGVFVERQTLGLAALPGTEVVVVSPVGIPVWPLTLHPHYRPRTNLPDREVWKGLPIHRPRYRVWPVVGARWAASAMAQALLPLVRGIRNHFPFDVIDAEFFWPDGPAAMLLSQALNVPYSVKARGADIQYWGNRKQIRPQIVAAGMRADGMLSVSAALRTVMASLGMPRERITVHYTGVDLDRFRPAVGAPSNANFSVAGHTLISVGALIARKGQRVTIAALEQLPGVNLLLVGDGPDRTALKKLVHAKGLAGRVQFLGNRPHDELPALLAAADVMVLPSTSEGLANVWVEALACGTPIVISDVGGAREVLADTTAGRIVPPEAGAIASAVRELLAIPKDVREGRRAAERFSWDTNSRELRRHLASIVAARTAGAQTPF